MKLVLTLLSRDEADIIGSTIDFHLARGVDYIVATDNASSDDTPNILRSYEDKGVLHLLHEPRHTHDQAAWVSRMAAIAKREYEADWIIHCDADEFWWSSSPNLKEEFARVPPDVSALSVERFNFLPPLDQPALGTPFYEAQTIRERQSLNSFGLVIPPKICHRSLDEAWIGDGNHKLFIDGQLVQPLAYQGMEILHFPIRSLAQLERKVRNGAEALARNTRVTPYVGFTWRHLYRILQETGSLADYYQSLCCQENDNRSSFPPSHLLEDYRLRTFFQRLQSI